MIISETEGGPFSGKMEVIPVGEGYVVQGREEERKMLRYFCPKRATCFIAYGLGELGKVGRAVTGFSKTSMSVKFHALFPYHGN